MRKLKGLGGNAARACYAEGWSELKESVALGIVACRLCKVSVLGVLLESRALESAC